MRTSTSLSTPSLSLARAGVMAIVVAKGAAGSVVGPAVGPAVALPASALIPDGVHGTEEEDEDRAGGRHLELLGNRQRQAKHRHDRFVPAAGLVGEGQIRPRRARSRG